MKPACSNCRVHHRTRRWSGGPPPAGPRRRPPGHLRGRDRGTPTRDGGSGPHGSGGPCPRSVRRVRTRWFRTTGWWRTGSRRTPGGARPEPGAPGREAGVPRISRAVTSSKDAVLPREAGKQVGHPHMADCARGGVVDGELTHVASLGVDAPLAEHLDQVSGGAADIERVAHPEVPPQQPSGDVGVGGDAVVTGVSRQPGPVARGIAPLAEVAPPVGIGDTGLASRDHGLGPLGGPGQLTPERAMTRRPGRVVAGHTDEGPPRRLDGRLPSGCTHAERG